MFINIEGFKSDDSDCNEAMSKKYGSAQQTECIAWGYITIDQLEMKVFRGFVTECVRWTWGF